MKKQVWMDPKTTYILIALLLLIPILLTKLPGAPAAFCHPREEDNRLLPWICFHSYFVLPSIFTFFHVIKTGKPTWILVLEFAVMGIFYSLWLHDENDIYLFSRSAILMCVLSIFPLVQNFAFINDSRRFAKILRELAQDWNYLLLLYFCSAFYLFSIQWLFAGTSYFAIFAAGVYGGMLSIILLILPGKLKKPLTGGGKVGVVLTMFITMVLVTDAFLLPGGIIYFVAILVAYAIMAIRLWGREYPGCVSDAVQ